MPDRIEIEALVLKSVSQLAEDFEISALENPQLDSPLYGEGGALDSMALVNLIADIEEVVAESHKANIVLADDKSMSAQRSPFRNVDSLIDTLLERIQSKNR
ncbi:MAG: hypothetical protein CL815_02300 [Coraliomargarita sp.]|nr:hypothetical protein [Coraliomargarita sp.]|tara:strand:- start:91 stop:396 length:306 start_codon:yes stop_codon:yes gene_type:complete